MRSIQRIDAASRAEKINSLLDTRKAGTKPAFCIFPIRNSPTSPIAGVMRSHRIQAITEYFRPITPCVVYPRYSRKQTRFPSLSTDFVDKFVARPSISSIFLVFRPLQTK